MAQPVILLSKVTNVLLDSSDIRLQVDVVSPVWYYRISMERYLLMWRLDSIGIIHKLYVHETQLYRTVYV